MSDMPTSSNFFGAIHTLLSRSQIARLFGDRRWSVRKSGDESYEVTCDWAELVIESESPILMHGLVSDPLENVDRILEVLPASGMEIEAECYGPNHELLRKWRRSSGSAGMSGQDSDTAT